MNKIHFNTNKLKNSKFEDFCLNETIFEAGKTTPGPETCHNDVKVSLMDIPIYTDIIEAFFSVIY